MARCRRNLRTVSADTPYDRLRHFLPETDELGLEGYKVLQPIGEGGFGRVFKARQLAFDRDVAIKVLSATGFQEETARRFERECLAIGALSGHPNIVTIYDSGISAWGRPFIVMEHMNGGSLGQKLASEGAFDPANATDIMLKIAGAVETAHRSGVLHRDIKPENLLLSAYGEPKLGDFGVASIPGGYQTHTGAITASLLHAAPEVLEGARATAAADVYALGSTLFTLLTGRAAFRAADEAGLQGLIVRTLTQPVPDLRDEGIPHEICEVIETAMAKDPSARYASAAAFGAALQQAQRAVGLPVSDMVLADPPPVAIQMPVAAGWSESRTQIRERVVVPPPSPPPPARRPVWRSPVTAAAVVLILTVATAGTLTMRSRRPAPSAARGPTGIAPTHQRLNSEIAERGAAAPEKRRRASKVERKRRARRTRRGGTIAFAGGSGGGTGSSAPGAGPSTSGPTNTYSSGGGGSQSSGGGGGSTSGGSGSQDDPPKPAPPPSANLILYHLYSENGDYAYTTSTGELTQRAAHYDDYHREAAIWDSGGSGMRRLCYGDGRCGGWVYIQKPAGLRTRPLYSFIGPQGDYYTTNQGEIPSQYSGYRVYLYGYVQ